MSPMELKLFIKYPPCCCRGLNSNSRPKVNQTPSSSTLIPVTIPVL
uniref:Uncharacterized protein n=1 Tax=Rhizophora mucronata TaxID=61149 RepID=A0A2P2QIW8_RHIMU